MSVEGWRSTGLPPKIGHEEPVKMMFCQQSERDRSQYKWTVSDKDWYFPTIGEKLTAFCWKAKLASKLFQHWLGGGFFVIFVFKDLSYSKGIKEEQFRKKSEGQKLLLTTSNDHWGRWSKNTSLKTKAITTWECLHVDAFANPLAEEKCIQNRQSVLGLSLWG